MGANADVVQSAWEAFGRQDLDGATADVDESSETIVPDVLPWGGTYRGPGGFKEMIGKFMSQMEDFQPQPEAFLEADDDHVVVPVNVSARAKTGKDLSGRALWLYRLQGGKFVRAELFVDTATTLDALS